MRGFIACALILLLVQGECQSLPTRESAIAGEWWLMPVLPSDTATGHIPTLNFDITNRKFKGFTGCNDMTGSITVKGDAISFDKDIVFTRMACEGYNEKDFIANLMRVDHYRLKDGVLTLLIDKTPVSKWMRRAKAGVAP